jgi:hypothetical protein
VSWEKAKRLINLFCGVSCLALMCISIWGHHLVVALFNGVVAAFNFWCAALARDPR